MAKRPAEVFGFPIEVTGGQAERCRQAYRCPFMGKKCDKKSRLLTFPMGVCSVTYGEGVISLCPRRFLEKRTVFKDVAELHFGGTEDLLVFQEVGLAGIGTFDYVMVKHERMGEKIEDFVVIEFQGGQTTGTGKLVQALKEFMGGDDIREKSYGFGLNLADIWKRAFTQVLTKGMVLESWGQKIFWVVQAEIYENLRERYRLEVMDYNAAHSTVFMVYDLESRDRGYELVKISVESATVDQLFDAFRNNRDLPSKEAFLRRLEGKMKVKLGLRVRFD